MGTESARRLRQGNRRRSLARLVGRSGVARIAEPGRGVQECARRGVVGPNRIDVLVRDMTNALSRPGGPEEGAEEQAARPPVCGASLDLTTEFGEELCHRLRAGPGGGTPSDAWLQGEPLARREPGRHEGKPRASACPCREQIGMRDGSMTPTPTLLEAGGGPPMLKISPLLSFPTTPRGHGPPPVLAKLATSSPRCYGSSLMCQLAASSSARSTTHRRQTAAWCPGSSGDTRRVTVGPARALLASPCSDRGRPPPG